MEQLKVGPENTKAIAAIAASLRRRAEQIEPSYSTRQIIDVCYPGTVVTGRHMPKVDDAVHVDAAAFRSHRAPNTIIYQRSKSTDERRIAIAHALGHVIFDGPRHAGCVAYNADRELRCDRFAEELLIPLDELEPYVGRWPAVDPDDHEDYLDMVDQISSHFHVPSRIVIKRIQALRVSRL